MRRWNVKRGRDGGAAVGIADTDRPALRHRLHNETVARELGIWPQMVSKWRCFVAKRLEGLLDEARPGTPRKISGELVEGEADHFADNMFMRSE